MVDLKQCIDVYQYDTSITVKRSIRRYVTPLWLLSTPRTVDSGSAKYFLHAKPPPPNSKEFFVRVGIFFESLICEKEVLLTFLKSLQEQTAGIWMYLEFIVVRSEDAAPLASRAFHRVLLQRTSLFLHLTSNLQKTFLYYGFFQRRNHTRRKEDFRLSRSYREN